MRKILPFTQQQVRDIAGEYPTPFYLYDEAAIRQNARKLLKAFSWAPGFREYFAVKACPNPYIMKILMEEGFGADCSSLPELLLAEKVGLAGSDIMFSSNNTPAAEFIKARQMESIITIPSFTLMAACAEDLINQIV